MGKMGIILIAGVLIAFLLVGGSLFNLLNKGGSAVIGTNKSIIGGGIRVNYDDGTFDDFKPDTSFIQIPFTISSLSGKVIDTVQLLILGRLDTSKTCIEWSISGTQQVELYRRPESAPRSSSSIPVQASGTSWVTGDTKTLKTIDLGWKSIDDVCQKYGDGEYFLQVNLKIDAHFAFSDGLQNTFKDLTTTAGFAFNHVKGTVTDFSVDLRADYFSIQG